MLATILFFASAAASAAPKPSGDPLCSQLATIVDAAKNDFQSLKGGSYTFSGVDVWFSKQPLGSALACSISKPLLSDTLEHSCNLTSSAFADVATSVGACFSGVKPEGDLSSGKQTWSVSPAARVTVRRADKGADVVVQAIKASPSDLFSISSSFGTSGGGTDACAAMKAVLADQRASGMKMGGAYRANQKMNAHDYAKKIPGAKDCWVEKPQGLFPEVVCAWANSEQELAKVQTELKSCLPDWGWTPGTYSGVRGSKQAAEKDTQYIELVHNKLFERVELRFTRQCSTTACFNEKNPGLLDGDDDMYE